MMIMLLHMTSPWRKQSALRRGAVLTLAGALAWTSGASSQEAARDFGDIVEVEVVNVEVRVTDGRGRPVSGLRREDFELYQDGRRVEVQHFAAASDGLVRASAAEASPQIEALRAAAGAATVEPSHLVVLVDNLHLRPGHRRRVLRSVSEFLDARRQPGERFMVATFDAGIHVRQNFTADHSLVEAALRSTERLSAHGVARDGERRRTFDAILQLYQANNQTCVPEMEQVAKAYASEQFHQVATAISGLGQFVDSLGGLPGRKALLYVSDGFPARSGEDILALLQELCESGPAFLKAQQFDASGRLKSLGAAANANRVTLYTLEASGLEAPPSSAADVGDLRLVSLGIDRARVANLEDTLHILADETGGRALLNRNDWDTALAGVTADLASYYSLGFAPGHAAESAEHRLEVRVRSPGVRVNCRKSYRHKTVTERLSDQTIAALLLERQENPLAVALAADPPEPAGRRRFVSKLRLTVPLHGLALLPEGERRAGRVRLFVAVRDVTGATTPVRTVDLAIQAPAGEGAAPGAFRYDFDLQTGPGEQLVAVGVHDTIGATSSFLRLPLDLPVK